MPWRELSAETKSVIQQIIARMSSRHRVTVGELMSRKQDQKTTWARANAVHEVAKEFPDISHMELSAIFYRSHTDVLYLLRKVDKDPRTRNEKSIRCEGTLSPCVVAEDAEQLKSPMSRTSL